MANVDGKFTDEARIDIQGYITSAYGHLDHAAYLFLQVKDAAKGKTWLQGVIDSGDMTNAVSWRTDKNQPKERPLRTLNMALTFEGFIAFGVSHKTLCTFPHEFQQGMNDPRRSPILGDVGDSAPIHWEVGGRAPKPDEPQVEPKNPQAWEPVHIFMVFKAANDADIKQFVQEYRAGLAATEGGVIELTDLTQWGVRVTAKEPFGFTDGAGQPQIEGVKGLMPDEERIGNVVPTGEFILGYKNAYSFFPSTPIVPAEEDPENILPRHENPNQEGDFNDLGTNGTYIVYRKLKQDVAGFWDFMKHGSTYFTKNHEPDAYQMVRLASKFVGRWPSGAPLTLAPEKDNPALGQNFIKADEFLYIERDRDGLKCPIGSHLRRSNPRDVVRPIDTKDEKQTEKSRKRSLLTSSRHRIIRRAMPFGQPLFDHSILDNLENREALQQMLSIADDGQERGVHFFAINANIHRQFEFIQQAWGNNPNFNGLSENKDPIIGDNDHPNQPPSHMTVPEKDRRYRSPELPRFVTVIGGLYLFMPSFSALRFLAHQ